MTWRACAALACLESGSGILGWCGRIGCLIGELRLTRFGVCTEKAPLGCTTSGPRFSVAITKV